MKWGADCDIWYTIYLMSREQYRAVLHCERVKWNRVYRIVGNQRVQLVTALNTLMEISENRTMAMCCAVSCCVMQYNLPWWCTVLDYCAVLSLLTKVKWWNFSCPLTGWERAGWRGEEEKKEEKEKEVVAQLEQWEEMNPTLIKLISWS